MSSKKFTTTTPNYKNNKLNSLFKKLYFLLFRPKKWFKSYGSDNDIGFFNWFTRPENTSIGDATFIYFANMFYAGDYEIKIGSGCHIATHNFFITYSHDFNAPDLVSIPYDKRYIGGDIIIEDGVWIGSHCTILPGVTIGKGAVIAAGAVVSKDVPSYEVWGGNPAKKISERKNKELFDRLLKEKKFRRLLP
ncbi:hypothetical protein CSB09_03100 [Candidatus Gracilibacteria bacterium]|nr:MAG: hypothetical protein CSB09_03100 [Candidatus Gracilibacteria bacterium]